MFIEGDKGIKFIEMSDNHMIQLDMYNYIVVIKFLHQYPVPIVNYLDNYIPNCLTKYNLTTNINIAFVKMIINAKQKITIVNNRPKKPRISVTIKQNQTLRDEEALFRLLRTIFHQLYNHLHQMLNGSCFVTTILLSLICLGCS